jgi:hypothetical protein
MATLENNDNTSWLSIAEYIEWVNPYMFRANRKDTSKISGNAIKYRIKQKLPMPYAIEVRRVAGAFFILVNNNL